MTIFLIKIYSRFLDIFGLEHLSFSTRMIFSYGLNKNKVNLAYTRGDNWLDNPIRFDLVNSINHHRLLIFYSINLSLDRNFFSRRNNLQDCFDSLEIKVTITGKNMLSGTIGVTYMTNNTSTDHFISYN